MKSELLMNSIIRFRGLFALGASIILGFEVGGDVDEEFVGFSFDF
jgi:hypothetical protein